MLGFIFLQSGSQQLDQAANQITKASIELAEATANYGALKVIFGIFMIFMILIVVLFIYQIFTLTRKVDNIHNAALKTQEYFEGAADRTIGEVEANVIIRRSLNQLSQAIKYYILRIRIENHIDDKEGTKHKVAMIARNEYSELRSFLSNFICNDKQLSDVLNDEDMEVAMSFALEQIYIPNGEFSISNMDQSVDLLVNGFKLNCLRKL